MTEHQGGIVHLWHVGDATGHSIEDRGPAQSGCARAAENALEAHDARRPSPADHRAIGDQFLFSVEVLGSRSQQKSSRPPSLTRLLQETREGLSKAKLRAPNENPGSPDWSVLWTVAVVVPLDHTFGWKAPVIHLGRGFS